MIIVSRICGRVVRRRVQIAEAQRIVVHLAPGCFLDQLRKPVGDALRLAMRLMDAGTKPVVVFDEVGVDGFEQAQEQREDEACEREQYADSDPAAASAEIERNDCDHWPGQQAQQ